jgi:hypothetical protein
VSGLGGGGVCPCLARFIGAPAVEWFPVAHVVRTVVAQ